RLEPEMCVDRSGRPTPPESSWNLEYLREVMEAFGLSDSYSVLLGADVAAGVSRSEALERVEASALLLRVHGYVADPAVLARASLAAFLDIDPGFGQMWRQLGLRDLIRRPDAYVPTTERI